MSELRSKMIRAMELRDFSPRTHESYLAAVAGLAKFHKKSPDLLTHQEIEDYLLHLKVMGKSSSTRNVVTAGLRFFYEQTLENMTITLKLPQRKKPRLLPEVLSKPGCVWALFSAGHLRLLTHALATTPGPLK